MGVRRFPLLVLLYALLAQSFVVHRISFPDFDSKNLQAKYLNLKTPIETTNQVVRDAQFRTPSSIFDGKILENSKPENFSQFAVGLTNKRNFKSLIHFNRYGFRRISFHFYEIFLV